MGKPSQSFLKTLNCLISSCTPQMKNEHNRIFKVIKVTNCHLGQKSKYMTRKYNIDKIIRSVTLNILEQVVSKKLSYVLKYFTLHLTPQSLNNNSWNS